MEFWGAEVKVGETLKVDPNEFETCIHLSQAALGESKKDKENDSVVLFVKVGEQKLVLGTLLKDKIPQISLELVLDKEFELSHNSKTASVHFFGYRALFPGDYDSDSSEYECTDNDEDDDKIGSSNDEKREKGKKRPNESVSKTPVPSKKSKNATPEKTDGKKSGHTATPHPKKGGKTPNTDAISPKSGGQLSCGSCSKTFSSYTGLEQHSKAKHGAQ